MSSGKRLAQDLGLLVLRIGLGLSFMVHGFPKVTGGPETWHGVGLAMGNFGIHFLPTFWGFCAAMAEFGGGLCLAFGFLTRLVCLALVVQMTVAISFHLGLPPESVMHAFATGWSHPLEDGIVFFALILIGPGAFSVDARMFERGPRITSRYDLTHGPGRLLRPDQR